MKSTVPCSRLVVVQPTIADVASMSIDTARQVVSNNKVIEAVCGKKKS